MPLCLKKHFNIRWSLYILAISIQLLCTTCHCGNMCISVKMLKVPNKCRWALCHPLNNTNSYVGLWICSINTKMSLQSNQLPSTHTHGHKCARSHKQTKSSLSIAGRSPPRWSGWRGMKEREARTADVRPRFSQRLASEGKRWRGGGRRRGLNKQQKNDSH